MNIKKVRSRIREISTALEQSYEEQERIDRTRLSVSLLNKRRRLELVLVLLLAPMPTAICALYFWEVAGDRYVADVNYRRALEIECARSFTALRQGDGGGGTTENPPVGTRATELDPAGRWKSVAQPCLNGDVESCMLLFRLDLAGETCTR
jgi:hypothetical protein